MGRVDVVQVVLAALVVGGLVTSLSAAVRVIRRGRRGRTRGGGAAVLDGALAASVAAVAVATLSPLSLLGTRLDQASEINLRPFEALRGAPEVFAVVNVLLLVPTILLLAGRWRRAGIVRLTLAGAAMSLAVECAQLVHPTRGTNVDDLALNTAGAFVAAVVGVTIRRLSGRARPSPTRDPARHGGRGGGSGVREAVRSR